MTEQQFKRLAIEYAVNTFKAELWSFSKFYDKTTCAEIVGELFDDHAIVKLKEQDGTVTDVTTIYFEDVPKVIGHPFDYTEDLFMPLVAKYELKHTEKTEGE